MGMTKLSFRKLAMGTAIAALLLLQLAAAAACEKKALGECKGESELIRECQKYVRKGAPDKMPSESCCSAIKDADIPCLCKLVTPGIANLIDIKRVCTVAKHCNVKLPPVGSDCGSEKVPKC